MFSFARAGFGINSRVSRQIHKSSSLIPWCRSSIRMRPHCIPSKSSRHWSMNDLKRLKISVEEMSPEKFFGCKELSELPTPQFIYPQLAEILTAGVDVDDGPRPRDFLVRDLFRMIRAANEGARESTMDDLAKALLTYMGYQGLSEDGIEISVQHTTDFQMNGRKTTARPDLGLLNTRLLLLFAEDKRLLPTAGSKVNPSWPHAQVVAHGLSAFNMNTLEASKTDSSAVNFFRAENFGMVFPVFSFIGPAPCWYLVPITSSLASAVARGEIPPHPTRFFCCPAPVDKSGMLSNENRILVLKMFQAFKHFVPAEK